MSVVYLDDEQALRLRSMNGVRTLADNGNESVLGTFAVQHMSASMTHGLRTRMLRFARFAWNATFTTATRKRGLLLWSRADTPSGCIWQT